MILKSNSTIINCKSSFLDWTDAAGQLKNIFKAWKGSAYLDNVIIVTKLLTM